MDILRALLEFVIDMGVFGAVNAFSILNVEDGGFFGADDAFLTIEERSIEGAIGDIIVLNASLVVLFDQVVDGEGAQNPALGVDVSLEDGWT